MTCQTAGGEILGIPGRIPDDGKIYLHNQRMGKVVIKEPKRIHPDFVYYLTLWSEFNRALCSTASGSKILHTAPVRIEAFEFNLPALPEQKAIASILGALDDKIELNRRMNTTLETMALTLFQSWFLDFDPVRAKQEGRIPAGLDESTAALDESTAALFPSQFQDSELGEIPRGWELQPLGNLLDTLETGRRPKGGVGSFKHGIPSIGAESIHRVGEYDYGKTKFIPEEFFAAMKSGYVQSYDVLLYKDGGKPGVFLPRVSMFGEGFPFENVCDQRTRISNAIRKNRPAASLFSTRKRAPSNGPAQSRREGGNSRNQSDRCAYTSILDAVSTGC